MVAQVIQLLQQFELCDVVISLVKLAIDIAERDDPNLVCCFFLYLNVICGLFYHFRPDSGFIVFVRWQLILLPLKCGEQIPVVH